MRRYSSIPLLLALSVILGAQQPTTASASSPRALFEKGLNALIGAGTSRSDQIAFDSIHRSADLGYAPAQDAMGYFFETGTLTATDSQQAVIWYRKAADQGDRLGEWLLGRAYFLGSGVPRDLESAERWLREVANQGDPFAQYLLGSIRQERNDYRGAAEWFRKAADQGLPQAQKRLGLLLKQGQGVAEDKFEAYVWLLLSFEAGSRSIANDLKQLEAELGSNQVEQAKNQARDRQQVVARAVVARGCTGWSGEFAEMPSAPPPDLQRFCR